MNRKALTRQACSNVAGKPLVASIAERLVTAVTPLTIELALEALTSLEERDKAIAAQWRRRIERARYRSEEHTSELQSRQYLVCRLLLEKKKKTNRSFRAWVNDTY